jgi:16S rRNA (cytosine967-C5)-methyltransferase
MVDWADRSVLDYCAGGGGKSLAIAGLGARRIVAHDADPRRMSDLAPRAARAGAQIAVRSTAELAAVAPFDVVLCDVPCSGSGTWRRDPEAKWRLTPNRLAELVALQAEILDRTTRYVRSGGRLVYMTCSLFPVENSEQVQGFLERHPNWRCQAQGGDTPLTASDGFFFAVFEAP